MGNFLSSGTRESVPDVPVPAMTLRTETARRRKRHMKPSAESSPKPITEPPVKRKKLKTTSEYIYDALFVHGENSDITIRSLGKEWKLHKVYLRQAGYFKGMFHSSWKESSMEAIDLQIPDNNIDVNALHVAFGSLYSEDVLICATKVVSILAAASLIQLDGLMQQCAEVMKETVNLDNVCNYLKIASMYGQDAVSKHCISWLETNLMMSQSQTLLREIEPDLLAEVIASPNLIVIQIEMDIYTMVKKWLYLRLDPSYSGDFKGILSAADAYFQQESEISNSFFLDTDVGKPYVPVFQSLRLQHIIRDFVSCREVEKDKIIPWSWLSRLYRQQWLTMLRVEQNIESGPSQCTDEFEANGLRCGRLLLRDTDHCWRWNGYNFGLDLLVTYSSQSPRMISLRRNVRSQRCSSSVSLSSTRSIIFRILVASVNDKGQTMFRLSTGNAPLSLDREQEKTVLTINNDALPDSVLRNGGWSSCFPLLITATFQLVSNLNAPDLTRTGFGILPFPDPNDDTPTLGDTLLSRNTESSPSDEAAVANV